MRRVTLLALSLMLVGVCSHDGARAQTSATPPVSLAPPDVSPPRASARPSRKPPPAGREISPPVIGGLPAAPNPAADYDGLSAVEDNDPPGQAVPTARPRATTRAKSNPETNAEQSSIDQEDEALKRKLTICKNCK